MRQTVVVGPIESSNVMKDDVLHVIFCVAISTYTTRLAHLFGSWLNTSHILWRIPVGSSVGSSGNARVMLEMFDWTCFRRRILKLCIGTVSVWIIGQRI